MMLQAGYAGLRGAGRTAQRPQQAVRGGSPMRLQPAQGVYLACEKKRAQYNSDKTQAMIAKLTDIIRDRSALKKKIGELFRDSTAIGHSMLNFNQMSKFIHKVSETFEVPLNALEVSHDDFERYDFDGDGVLADHECYRLVKSHLKAFRKKLGHSHDEHQIPFLESVTHAGLTLGKELGHGSFGKVMLATHKDGSQKCVKEIKKTDMKGAGLEELKEEFEIMHHMHNENIARTYDFFHNHTHYYLVNEPYYGGDLSKIWQKTRRHNVQVTEDYWRGLFWQCFNGLNYLHNHAMMHCDIKEENLMLKTENYHAPEVVIIDFGLAQHHADEKQQICGTPGYIPPETWQNMKWFPRGDVFSMGVTMLQLVIDQIPEVREAPVWYGAGMAAGGPQVVKAGIFGGCTFDEVKRKTCTVQAPMSRIPANMPGFSNFVAKCLQKERFARPKALQALSDPWFAEMPSARLSEPAVSETNDVCLTNTISSSQQVEPLTLSSNASKRSISTSSVRSSTPIEQQLQRVPSPARKPSPSVTRYAIRQQVQRTSAPPPKTMNRLLQREQRTPGPLVRTSRSPSPLGPSTPEKFIPGRQLQPLVRTSSPSPLLAHTPGCYRYTAPPPLSPGRQLQPLVRTPSSSPSPLRAHTPDRFGYFPWGETR